MRPIVRGSTPTVHGRAVRFARYQDARPALLDRVGSYCSYCEIAHPSLAIEHVQPKSKRPRLLTRWSNFLLSCPYCNSTKGRKKIIVHKYLWPDRDNTFRAFAYSSHGKVGVATTLNSRERVLAQNTMLLFGLNRDPSTTPPASLNDRRWKIRYESGQIASRSLHLLTSLNVPQMREQIVMTAVAQGCWSVWLTVFATDSDMVRR